MWIGWTNPKTGKPERVYNFYDMDDPAGRMAIRIARNALAEKFSVEPEADLGFHVESASWERLPLGSALDGNGRM
jgi:hypothetical protein